MPRLYTICAYLYRPPRPATPPSIPKLAAPAEGAAKGPAAAGEKKRKVNPIRDNISGERVRVYYCLSLSLL